MEIHGPGQIHGPQSIKAPQRLQPAQAEAIDHRPLDQVEISAEADFVSQIRDLPDIRADRVDVIRTQIDAGAYETDEKIEIAVGRLLDEIG